MSGRVLELSADDYHADNVDPERPTLSSSVAQILCDRSPAHARAAHPRLAETPVVVEAKHYDVGSAVHSLLLEPHTALVCRVEANDWKTKAAQEARKAARELGLIPLLDRDADKVEACVAAIRPRLEAYSATPAFLSGQIERTLVWERDGVLCRARPDSLLPDTVDDLKTATSALPRRWTRTIPDHGYDLQAAMYLDGVEAILGTRAQWRWVVVEPYPPFAVTVVVPGADVLEVGRAKFRYALKWWRECLSSNVWPAYPAEVVEAELPPWADEARFLVDLPEGSP